MKKYKTVLFDMDGTVLDTLDELTNSLAAVFKMNNLPVLDRESVRARLGYGYVGLIARSAPQAAKEDQARLVKEFKEYYGAHCRGTTFPYTHIPTALRRLREKGYRTAIVSNKGQAAVSALHDEFFTGLVSFSLGETPDLPKKPRPDMLYEALRRLNSTPDEAIYVGDSEVDKKTADNAGMDVILVSWGFRDKSFLQRLNPAYLIDTADELNRIL